MTKITLTLTDPHDAQPDPNRPSRREIIGSNDIIVKIIQPFEACSLAEGYRGGLSMC
jgi:hypothetical protein